MERVAQKGNIKNAYKDFVRKYGKKGGGLENLCMHTIKLDFEEIMCEVVTWIHLPQDTVLSRVLLNTVIIDRLHRLRDVS
jgi:hypothetical protein